MAHSDDKEYLGDYGDGNTAPKAGQPQNSSEPYDRSVDDTPPGDSPTGGMIDNEEDSDQLNQEAYLIQRAREIYTASTDYMDANITNQWETNLSHFHSEHSDRTKSDCKKRGVSSAVFRPKTRANVKAQEAALAMAVFSTADVADIKPQNPLDPIQKISAQINKELLTNRIENHMPWFQTVLGAWQDTKVYGLCITHQYWNYQVDTDVVPALDGDGKLVMDNDAAGGPRAMGHQTEVVRHDDLCCDNVAPENFRFDPMCDWRNPAQSSPYIVNMVPMYAGDVLERMESVDPKTGQPAWNKHTLAAVLGTRRQEYDRTRQSRQGQQRIDAANEQHGNSFTTVWAHMNIIRINGEDMMYWTMGTDLLLTTPVKLVDVYPHLKRGERPFTVGFSSMETHRNYPAGDVEQTAGLQSEINLVSNQRLDNVKLILNKRYYVRRGSQIDLDALIRNVPGGGVFMNDPDRDIKTESTPDVTASSYQEQDRLGMEFDDIAGGIGQMQNGDMNKSGESLGSANMASQSAGLVQDYGIRIFMETWLEPTIKQMVRLIQRYETDVTTLAIVADRLELWTKFGVESITDEIIQQQLNIRINVGMGNTDPMRRVERLIYGVSKAIEIPGMVERVKSKQIADEIMGSLGYRDSSVFFMTDEEVEETQSKLPPPGPTDEELRARELDIREADNNFRDQRENAKMAAEQEMRMADIASREGIKLEELYARLGLDEKKLQTSRDIAALQAKAKSNETNLKRAQGK